MVKHPNIPCLTADDTSLHRPFSMSRRVPATSSWVMSDSTKGGVPVARLSFLAGFEEHPGPVGVKSVPPWLEDITGVTALKAEREAGEGAIPIDAGPVGDVNTVEFGTAKP